MLGNLKERFLTHFNKNLGDSQRYTAFTLAEVLIVLGIIGIVAALTIPTLMMNAQKHEYVTGLKKFYSTWNNGFAQMLADEGVQELDDTSVFQSMTGGGFCELNNAKETTCEPFFNGLKKYFKFTVIPAPSTYKRKYMNGKIDFTRTSVLLLPD